MRRKPQHARLRIGDRLQKSDDSTTYIIAQIGETHAILISLSNGNRWNSGYRGVLHPYLPWEAVNEICRGAVTRFRVLGRNDQPTAAEIYAYRQ